MPFDIDVETVRHFDRVLIFTLAIFFIPKGALFLITALLSQILTPPQFRTRLGDAYRLVFYGLCPFSWIMGILFFIRWMNNRPVHVDGSLYVAIGLRIFILVIMLVVSIAEIWVMRELWRRVQSRIFGDLDQIATGATQ